jgi:hypothetical protein
MTYDDATAGAHGPTRPVRRNAAGTQLLHASWALLRQVRELLWLPVLGAVVAVLAAVIPSADLPLRERTGDAGSGASAARRRVPQQVTPDSSRMRTGTVRNAA